MAQVFMKRKLSEKFVNKGKRLYVAYMDLEKSYDIIDSETIWLAIWMFNVNNDVIREKNNFH